MLTISGLDFAYGSKQVFDRLNCQVVAGEHVVIVGDSGGGKSTLLKLIADNQHSAIQFDDNRSSTMVMQEGALLDHLNVIQNLHLVARYASHSNTAEPKAILEQLNIESGLHAARISQLSGGQMRRVAIARALLTNPDIILFDEPDAGLDIVNLTRLAETINTLSQQNKACISVSHNPFYIAQVASKVYRLQGKQLTLIAQWPTPPANEREFQQRQLQLQNDLAKVIDPPSQTKQAKAIRDWPSVNWLNGVFHSAASIAHLPKSPRDECAIAAYTVYLSLITGLLFYALVGAMLGATTIAVVRMLADNTLTGLISFLIKPETLIELMGGRFVLYLAPAIGGMLFAARSGSIISNWLGEMVRSRQVQALSYLGVTPAQYLSAPTTLAMFLSALVAILWFAASVWLGGVLTTLHLFDIPNAVEAMSLSQFDIQHSKLLLKASLYSAFIALTVTGLGLAPKKTAHQVNIHTTKTIIYATLCIALTELIIILS